MITLKNVLEREKIEKSVLSFIQSNENTFVIFGLKKEPSSPLVCLACEKSVSLNCVKEKRSFSISHPSLGSKVG